MTNTALRAFTTCLSVSAAVCHIAPAAAATDDTVARALALHAAGLAQQAFELLAPLEDEQAGNPDYDYAFGLAAADSGQLGRAIAALQRVLAVQPANAQARAEIARVYAMAGDLATAKTEFDTVIADPSLPDPVRQQLNSLSRRYGVQLRGGNSRVTGFFDIEGGYDSNVNAATSATSITLPVFAFLGPATLGGNATRRGELFGQAQAGISLDLPLSRQTKLFASGLGLWRDALNGKAFDQAAVTGTLGVAHSSASGHTISIAGQSQQFWLAHEGYRASHGAIGQYTRRLKGGDALSFAAQYARFDYRSDSLRDADRFTGTISYAGEQIFAAVGAGTEDTRRPGGRHLGYALATAQLGSELPLSPSVSFVAGVSAEYRNYHGEDPLFAAGRRDMQVDASLSLRLLVAKALTMRPRVTMTRNDSNLALYDYRRATVSLSIRKEF